MPQRKLFAVLCAINDYKWPVSELKGCVNDAEEWRSLLSEQDDYFDIQFTLLHNEQAVKENILAALMSALDNADINDVVFFYYSGHGARESSYDVFRDIDSDGAFETLVSYDGITHDGEIFKFNLISDKELHYIISKHAKAGTHVVFVLDSCHSGNITRNAIDYESDSIRKRQFKPPADATSKLSMKAPQRAWSDFIFGDILSAKDIENVGWFESVPQRPHIAMSACLNDESAFEVEGHGVFTTNLIKILRRTQCEISYRSLQARVRQFVRNQLNQTPEIFSTRENAEDLLLNFLSKEGEPRPFRANCYYSNKNKWTLDLGSIHGMRHNSGPVVIETRERDLSVKVGAVTSNCTELLLSEEQLDFLIAEHAYDARVENYLNGGTSFYIEEMEDSDFKELLTTESDKLTSATPTALNITEKRSEAQYVIYTNTDCITIAKNTRQKYPVWRTLSDERAVDRLVRAMSQISKWEYVRSYDNPDVSPDGKYAVELYMELSYPNSKPVEVAITHDKIEFAYVKGTTMRIRLDNKSEHKYFCALLYLSNTFEVVGDLLDGKVKGVQAASSEWALNGRSIPVTMEQHVVDFKMPASLSYIKLIANEEAFEVEAMEQSGLRAPKPKCADNAEGPDGTRGLAIDKGITEIKWFTRTIELKILNQEFE
jgi:caspase domain-containing protein